MLCTQIAPYLIQRGFPVLLSCNISKFANSTNSYRRILSTILAAIGGTPSTTTTDRAAVLDMADGRDPNVNVNWGMVNTSAPNRESTCKLKLDHMMEMLPVSNINEQHGFVPLLWVMGPTVSPCVSPYYVVCW